MIQLFKTDEEYVKWLNGQTLPSGIVVYVSDDETMYFSTNNIKGELKTYKCEKEEPIQPIQPNKLVYSTNAAGSRITVNGQSMTLEQGDNIVLDYPNEITSLKAEKNTALTYIQIPNTVTNIGNNTFYNCSKLASIAIPNSVKSIGNNTFYNCPSLASIAIPNSVKSIGGYVFGRCSKLASIDIPNSVTSIGEYAFYNCSKLASIAIPDGVTNIGDNTFYNCSSLASITIPNGVTNIGNNTFNGCDILTDFNYNGTKAQWASITLGTNWKNRAPFTVVHCTDGDVSLEKPIQPIQPNKLVYSANATGSTITVNKDTITLECGENIVLDYPNEITSVDASYNTALTFIQIPNTVTSIRRNEFNSCSSLSSIKIPESVTSIGRAAFGSCYALSSVTIPSSVTSIGEFVFSGCKSLSSITIPDGISLIDNYTFNSCSLLEYVNIPNSVTVINNNVFDGCGKMKYINYNGTKAQWASITLGKDWKNNAPFTVVHCTDGDVTLS